MDNKLHYIIFKYGMQLLHSQTHHHWEMNKYFYPLLYRAHTYLSILGFDLIHVCQGGIKLQQNKERSMKNVWAGISHYHKLINNA